jgi:hypothetical protein
MRKLLLVLLGTVVMVVMLAVVTPVALASHGAEPSSVPVPSHGSIWMGNGLERYETTVPVPSHGSIWMGSGLERYETTIPAQTIEGETLNWPSEARFVTTVDLALAK